MNIKEMMELTAQEIKRARAEKGISIKELAKVSGLSVYKIKKIETGQYNFQLKEFDKIGEFLNIELILKKRP